jgi:hypothetical protein
MVHDMIEVEKMGKPAVPIVSGRFEGDAIASSRAFGMPELRFVVVPRIYRNLSDEDSIAQTEPAFDSLMETLTTDVEGNGQPAPDIATMERFEGEDRHDAVLRMNEEYITRDWGDTLPLFTATQSAVDELVKGTNLPRDHVVCDMPPGFGLATIEKIATNAAMAGARPEHMPIIIGAVKALSQMGTQGGKAILMSTSPNAPLLVVNGPIAGEVGLNPRSALGPGRLNRINITIGRAFALCLRNIGYWYLDQMDMDTIGTTRKFIACIAENEQASPWDPYHVDKGFKAEESTVTVFVGDGELDVQDQGNTSAEGLLKNLAYGATFGTRTLGDSHGRETLILIPPDVARPVGAQGFTKQGTKQFIHMHANHSLGKMIQYLPLTESARVAPQWKWLESLTEKERLDIQVPVLESADKYDILVVGADRAKTMVIPTGPSPFTVGVDQYRA